MSIIFGNLTQFDFVKIIRRRNETATPEEGIVSVGLLGGESGLFTPTISNIISDAIVENIEGIYSRSGGVVTGMFECDVTLDAGSNSTSFEFSLPILTDFANRNQLHCTCNLIANLVELDGEAVISDSKGIVSITSANNGDSLQRLTICYQYLIV